MRALAPLAALFVLATGCAGEEQPVNLPLGRELSAKATSTPSVHLFAEPVVARLDLVIDRDHLDPARVRPQTRFVPYDVEAVARKREERSRFTHLRYEYTLRCLRIACIPELLSSAAGKAESGRGERRSIKLPAAQVLYDDPEGETRLVTSARWPTLVSVSRINASDVERFGFVFKTRVTPLPEPDYRVSPTLLGAGLLAGSLALLALPAGLVVGWLRRRRPPPAIVKEPEVPPLERALRLVEWAHEREDGAERRQALEVLAGQLDAAESTQLAEAARALAWSPASPSPEAAARLVETVSETDGRP